MFKITQTNTIDHHVTEHRVTMDEFSQFKNFQKWLPFLEKDSFKSIELVTGDDSSTFTYKIDKILLPNV